MITVFVCLALAALWPIVFALISKAGAPGFDNARPRAWIDEQEGYRKRAHWAQLNGYEAFPPFAVAVFTAMFAGIRIELIQGLAIGFIVCRCVYGALYLANKPSARSLVWFAGVACTFALFVLAIVGLATR